MNIYTFHIHQERNILVLCTPQSVALCIDKPCRKFSQNKLHSLVSYIRLGTIVKALSCCLFKEETWNMYIFLFLPGIVISLERNIMPYKVLNVCTATKNWMRDRRRTHVISGISQHVQHMMSCGKAFLANTQISV